MLNDTLLIQENINENIQELGYSQQIAKKPITTTNQKTLLQEKNLQFSKQKVIKGSFIQPSQANYNSGNIYPAQKQIHSSIFNQLKPQLQQQQISENYNSKASNRQRYTSANKPHQLSQAQNISKIERLNQINQSIINNNLLKRDYSLEYNQMEMRQQIYKQSELNQDQKQSPVLMKTKSPSTNNLFMKMPYENLDRKEDNVQVQCIKQLAVKKSILAADQQKLKFLQNKQKNDHLFKQYNQSPRNRLSSFDQNFASSQKKLMNQMNMIHQKNGKFLNQVQIDNINEQKGIAKKPRDTAFIKTKQNNQDTEILEERSPNQCNIQRKTIGSSDYEIQLHTSNQIISTYKDNSNILPDQSILNKLKSFFSKGQNQNLEIDKIQKQKSVQIQEDTFIIIDKKRRDSYDVLLQNDQIINDIQIQEQFTCDCQRYKENYFACSNAMAWIKRLNKQQEIDLEKMKQLYNDILICNELNEYEDQINKDLARTFPKCEQFQEKEGQQQLKRVLLAFSRYDTTLGYVQGMNFIVGSILYHCNEEVAFWLFVNLIEEFEMRDIYEPGLPGLYKHCYIIENLMEIKVKDLFEHFKDHNILVEMYASDWIFCLFSNIIPIQMMTDFYNNFFFQGWKYFYQFSLSMLGVFKDKLLEEDEFSGILQHIKFKTPEKHIDREQKLLQSKSSPKKSIPMFVLDERSGHLQKQEIQEKQSTFQWFLDFFKKQDGIWQKIFYKCNSWGISDDLVNQIAIQYFKKIDGRSTQDNSSPNQKKSFNTINT